MKTFATTFGTKNFSESHLLWELTAKNKVDKCIPYNEDDLDAQFLKKNDDIFQFKKGFGYYVWKPYCILKTMNQMEEGDVCVYTDVCSTFIEELDPLFQECVKNGGIYLFDNRNVHPKRGTWHNSPWVKGDCFSMMDCDTEKYHKGLHVDAAFQVYQKNKKTMEFLEEYSFYCQNINIITEVPNIQGVNQPDFYEHRYDQSVLSLLSIKHNITLGREPSQWGADGITAESPYSTLFNHHRSRR